MKFRTILIRNYSKISDTTNNLYSANIFNMKRRSPEDDRKLPEISVNPTKSENPQGFDFQIKTERSIGNNSDTKLPAEPIKFAVNGMFDSVVGASKYMVDSATNLASNTATNVTEKSIESALGKC